MLCALQYWYLLRTHGSRYKINKQIHIFCMEFKFFDLNGSYCSCYYFNEQLDAKKKKKKESTSSSSSSCSFAPNILINIKTDVVSMILAWLRKHQHSTSASAHKMVVQSQFRLDLICSRCQYINNVTIATEAKQKNYSEIKHLTLRGQTEKLTLIIFSLMLQIWFTMFFERIFFCRHFFFPPSHLMLIVQFWRF